MVYVASTLLLRMYTAVVLALLCGQLIYPRSSNRAVWTLFGGFFDSYLWMICKHVQGTIIYRTGFNCEVLIARFRGSAISQLLESQTIIINMYALMLCECR